MLLTNDERLVIILSAIRDYIPGENDIAILIVEKVCKQIINSVTDSLTTQDIYDEVIECFTYYNDFIQEKKVDLKLIDEGLYELVRIYLNSIIEEVDDVQS